MMGIVSIVIINMRNETAAVFSVSSLPSSFNKNVNCIYICRLFCKDDYCLYVFLIWWLLFNLGL